MFARNILIGTTAALCGLAMPAAAQDASPARGRAIARAVCARCHAVQAHDASPMRAAPPFRTLAAHFPIDDLADVLIEGVGRRHPAMPDFRLAPGDAANLTAYLKAMRP